MVCRKEAELHVRRSGFKLQFPPVGICRKVSLKTKPPPLEQGAGLADCAGPFRLCDLLVLRAVAEDHCDSKWKISASHPIGEPIYC